jgi:hypothetical protein
MQRKNKGTTGEQLYTDTVITLAAPDLEFGKKLRRKGSAVISEVTSEQNGQVWKIPKVDIPAMLQGVNFEWPPPRRRPSG